MADMLAAIAEFGADEEFVRLLDDDGPQLLPYATLVAARRNGDNPLGIVEAVYEWQEAPLAFLVNADSVRDDDQLRRARLLLAMRGDAPYLGVVRPGSLRFYSIALDRKPLTQCRVRLGEHDDGARRHIFPRLVNERPHAAIARRQWVANVVLRLLKGSIDGLIALGISDEDAISLIGRALFTRFLGDRSLLPTDMSGAATARLFDSPIAAAKTSTWLDETFNGDLLPLSKGVFTALPSDGYTALGNVLRRAPDGQLFLDWKESWANLDFSHIPLGVMSQAYELYLREHAPGKQRIEGGYYTPAPVADLMVRASFRALEREGAAAAARVLDPAVGGGVFLLTAFRELVVTRWRTDGKRPDTDALRQIVRNQLAGFDINEAALRFTALGLYLLSIELDPNPKPVDKLRFDALRGSVLHLVKGGPADDRSLGSIGPLVGGEHSGRYDLVVGNPPWASRTGLPHWYRVLAKVRDIAAARGLEIKPPLPNQALDLPFVWRAMEWAKPGGQIALALHGRLLFQQGKGMPEARRAVVDALDVTSVVNGSELRQTSVWPEISAPFCLLFATNRRPGTESGFRLVTPRWEPLNESGVMRIDAINSNIVSAQQLLSTPEAIKVLARGSTVDLAILERVRRQEHSTLLEFWSNAAQVATNGNFNGSGTGYQPLRASSVRVADGRRGQDASRLVGRREMAVALRHSILINPSSLRCFQHKRVHRLRSPELYEGPLVLVHQSPLAHEGRIGAVVSDECVVFNESFYGYSAAGYPHAHTLVRYLALVLGSKLAVWMMLMTSGKFGFERDVIEKHALDRMPLLDFGKFDASQRGEVEALFERVRSNPAAWSEVDQWVYSLYGLTERDMEVIGDTLAFGLPFAENRRNAQATPGDADRLDFCNTLRDELAPWCARFGSTLAVEPMPELSRYPWQAVTIGATRGGQSDGVPVNWPGLLGVAGQEAATEIIVDSGPNQLLVARLAQRRYWSKTQARSLAQRIVWSHVDLLKAGSSG